MAMQDNTVLPSATTAGAGAMSPQIQAFLNLLMGGGLHEFGAFGGQPFGGFGQFLMSNPALMRGLGLTGGGSDVTPPVAAVAPPGADANVLTGGAPGPTSPPAAPLTDGQLGSGSNVLPPLGADTTGGGQINPATVTPTPTQVLTGGGLGVPPAGVVQGALLPPMLRKG